MGSFNLEVNAAIARWAPVYGVTIPAPIVNAIIQHESLGGKVLSVREPDGDTSRGPMHVKGSTARGMGFKPTDLMDPAVGISAGVKYLAMMLRKYNGDIPKAVAAYNGAGAAARAYAVKVLAIAKRYGWAAFPVGAVLAIGAVLLLSSRRRARAA